MKLHDINPHIRFAKHIETANFSNILRYCYDCRLFYIKKGSGTLKKDDKIYNFSNNTTFFIPPGSSYKLIFDKDDSAPTVLIFDFDLISDFAHIKDSLGTADESNFDPKKVIVYDLPEEFSNVIIQTMPHLYETLKKCTDEFLHKDKYYREYSSAIFKTCLIELLRKSTVASEIKVITQLTEYIHNHYHEPELTNKEIADKFGYHPYHLSRLMKQALGETLHTYLLHYRIRIAKNYLITTDWDISTIAWKCGFNSTSYFIKQFKIRTGDTPKQYRKFNQNLIF